MQSLAGTRRASELIVRRKLLPSNQFQSPQILFRPTGLRFDYALHRFQRERIAGPMRRHRYAPAVRMHVPLMGSRLADKTKAVALKGGDEFSRTERANATIVDGHILDGHGNMRIFLRQLGDLD